MACSTISKRITFHKLIFVALLCSTSLFLQADLGIEIKYNDGDDDWQLFLSGSYKIGCLEPNIKINPYKSFPENIMLKIDPNKLSNQKNIALVLASFTDASLNLAQYYLKKIYYHNEELEEKLIKSFLQKRKKNLQLLHETY